MNDTAEQPDDKDTIKKKQQSLINELAKKLIDTELQQYYPNCFNKEDIKPLKVGIRDDIRAEHPEINKRAIKSALKAYCSNKAYLDKIKVGNKRINLAGEEIEVITEAGEQYAKDKLKKMARSAERSEQNKILQKAQAKAEQVNKAKKAANIEKAKALADAKAEKKAAEQAKKIEQAKESKSEPTQKTKKPVIITSKKSGVKIATKRPTLSFLNKNK